MGRALAGRISESTTIGGPSGTVPASRGGFPPGTVYDGNLCAPQPLLGTPYLRYCKSICVQSANPAGRWRSTLAQKRRWVCSGRGHHGAGKEQLSPITNGL